MATIIQLETPTNITQHKTRTYFVGYSVVYVFVPYFYHYSTDAPHSGAI